MGEYDIAQTTSFNNQLFFPTAMLFFLHFKLGQVQPLIYQSASGILNLIYSPLWQAYVLGRNLERPFKIPSPLDNLASTADTDATASSNDEISDNDEGSTSNSEVHVEKDYDSDNSVEDEDDDSDEYDDEDSDE